MESIIEITIESPLPTVNTANKIINTFMLFKKLKPKTLIIPSSNKIIKIDRHKYSLEVIL